VFALRLGKAVTGSSIQLSLAMFLLSLSLRLICFFQIVTTPLFGFFARDSAQYDAFAAEILKGHLTAPESIYLNAAYPFFLAVVYALFGHSLSSVLLVQIVISSLTTVLVFLLCRKLSCSTFTSLLAALLHAGYNLSIFYAVLLLDTTLSAFLLVALLLALAHAADGRRPGLWFFSGALFGLSVVLRTNVAVYLPFLVVWVFTRENLTRRQMTRGLVSLGLGSALLVLPFSLRRYAIDGAASPFPASGGLNFYIGNGPEASGGFVSLEQLGIAISPVELIKQSVAVAERETGTRLTASAASRHWLVKGLRSIRDNPVRFVVLSLKKALLFWNKNEGESNINFAFSRQFLPLFDLPLVSFVVVGPLALTGMTLALWRRETAFSLVVAFVIAYLLSLCLVFMSSRYRLPCVPMIIILAADAANRCRLSLRAGKAGEIAAFVVLSAGFFLLANGDVPGAIASDNFSVARFNLGNLYLEKGQLAEAAGEYLKIPRSDPNFPRSRYNLGLVYERRGMVDEATAEYRKVLEAQPDFIKAQNNLGLICYRKGLKEEAFRHFRQALTINPDDAAANYNMAVAYFGARDLTKARQHYLRARDLGYPDNPAFRDALAGQRP